MATEEKILVFIDGSNLYSTCKHLNLDLDFKKLKKKLSSLGYVVGFRYYTAMAEGDEYNALRKLTDWLEFNGFDLVKKPLKVYTNRETGVETVKGNCDIEIAVDMVLLADKVDHMYLMSGDGDFTAAVKAVHDLGTRVSVISTMKTRDWMVSDELRRKAFQFVELEDWRADISHDRGISSNEFSLKKAG